MKMDEMVKARFAERAARAKAHALLRRSEVEVVAGLSSGTTSAALASAERLERFAATLEAAITEAKKGTP